MHVPAIAVKIFIIVLAFITLSCSLAPAWEGYVAATPDGDSLKIKKGHRIYEIRLYGIDSPEYGQSCWQEASGFTRTLVQGERVIVEPLDTDRYGRIVALVRKQGHLLNSELVRNGLAWVYPQYCQAQPLCSDMKVMERTAQKQGIGLWRERSPTPPWLWRRGRH